MAIWKSASLFLFLISLNSVTSQYVQPRRVMPPTKSTRSEKIKEDTKIIEYKNAVNTITRKAMDHFTNSLDRLRKYEKQSVEKSLQLALEKISKAMNTGPNNYSRRRIFSNRIAAMLHKKDGKDSSDYQNLLKNVKLNINMGPMLNQKNGKLLRNLKKNLSTANVNFNKGIGQMVEEEDNFGDSPDMLRNIRVNINGRMDPMPKEEGGISSYNLQKLLKNVNKPTNINIGDGQMLEDEGGKDSSDFQNLLTKANVIIHRSVNGRSASYTNSNFNSNTNSNINDGMLQVFLRNANNKNIEYPKRKRDKKIQSAKNTDWVPMTLIREVNKNMAPPAFRRSLNHDPSLDTTKAATIETTIGSENDIPDSGKSVTNDITVRNKNDISESSKGSPNLGSVQEMDFQMTSREMTIEDLKNCSTGRRALKARIGGDDDAMDKRTSDLNKRKISCKLGSAKPSRVQSRRSDEDFSRT